MMTFNSDTNLSDATFDEVDFSEAIFDGCECIRAKFYECIFGEILNADMYESNAIGCIFKKNIINTDMRGIYFAKSTFWHIAIKNTKLCSASLLDAIFKNAVFEGVSLLNTNASDAKFIDCTFKNVVLPYHHGFDHVVRDGKYFIDGQDADEDLPKEAREAFDKNMEFLTTNNIKY